MLVTEAIYQATPGPISILYCIEGSIYLIINFKKNYFYIMFESEFLFVDFFIKFLNNLKQFGVSGGCSKIG